MTASQIGRAMARHRWRVNPTYTVTERVLAHARKAAPLARAVQRGDHAEADRIREEHFPAAAAKRRLAKEMAKEMGKSEV